jgi:hypothetical protein
LKRLFTTSKFRKRNTLHALRSLRASLKSKEKRKGRKFKSKNPILIGQPLDRTEPFLSVPGPINFSFIDNTEEMLQYLDRLRTYFQTHKRVLVDLADITNLTNDAIVLMLAFTTEQSNISDCTIRGNYPRDEKLKKIFMESGVFPGTVHSGKRNYIVTKRNKKADGRIADNLIRRSTEALFGFAGRCPGVYRALMEAMANTCYHANPKEKAIETWFLSAYHNQERNLISFAFIDYGVGIFKSRKMRDLATLITSSLGFTDNKTILRQILEGKIESSTKLPYRGKGLPAIYKGLERNYYSNLKIISNNVKADPSNDIYLDLKREFSGTLIYFELNTGNLWIK